MRIRTAKINFITNLPLSEVSGGWSGISANIYHELSGHGPVEFVGPINPPYPMPEKLLSKIKRISGFRGRFTLFARRRLNQISSSYHSTRAEDVVYDLFHGATPWVHCNSPVLYGAYIDATFKMYLDIFSSPKQFLASDVCRISEAEGQWMRKAESLFFGSRWVRDIAIEEYRLPAEKCHVVWVGGNAIVPDKDTFSGGNKFLFISLNFEKKGGWLAVEAVKLLRKIVPDAELVILGARPPETVLAQDGVVYGGLLRKNVPEEYAEFCHHLSTARALVHPTSMDTMGAVLIEAAYYGCPSLASNRFGIPELVINHRTGYLLDVPINVEQITQFMLRMCHNTTEYQELRRNARDHAISNLTWRAVGSRIEEIIQNSISSRHII